MLNEQQPSLFNGDITYNNHGGNPESMAAFERIKDSRPAMQRRVLACVCAAGDATVKEVVRLTGLQRLTVGARLTELKAAEMVEKTGERREGCAVLRPTPKGRAFAHDA